MLNDLDDYPIHQTCEPIAHLAVSDRNAYDRTWFNGFTADGGAYFGIGMAVYPNRGIIDCAFSVVERGGRQHCFFGSARASGERTDMRVGPFRIEVVTPMRSARVVLDENDTGIRCELTFRARTPAFEEVRQTFRSGTRRIMDATRFDQLGRWSGTIHHPDGALDVDDARWFGVKDRSWGVRPVGEPEAGGAPGALGGAFFVWAPILWDDHVSHALFFDGPDGEPLIREALTVPVFASETEVPRASEVSPQRYRTAAHRLRYEPGTRFVRDAELEFVDSLGNVRRIELYPQLRFHMKGLGYLHPEWGHGRWKGELAIASESFDPAAISALDIENVHVQQIVRATDGTRVGVGVLEHLVYGPYGPAGLADYFDGAPGA